MVLTFESADENLRGDDPNETSPVAFSFIFLFSSILKNEICKLRKILTLIWPLVLSGRRLTRVIEVYGRIEILIIGLLRTFS